MSDVSSYCPHCDGTGTRASPPPSPTHRNPRDLQPIGKLGDRCTSPKLVCKTPKVTIMIVAIVGEIQEEGNAKGFGKSEGENAQLFSPVPSGEGTELHPTKADSQQRASKTR